MTTFDALGLIIGVSGPLAMLAAFWITTQPYGYFSDEYFIDCDFKGCGASVRREDFDAEEWWAAGDDEHYCKGHRFAGSLTAGGVA